jgi:hypothetical protein
VESEQRTRGRNKAKPWARPDEVSVIRLALDVRDPLQRRRLERMFEGAFSIRRALQHDARNRSRAYWAAVHERSSDPAALRSRLGLSRDALEDAAFRHLDRAPHLRGFVTKALAQHLADSVWSAAERHLYCDASGSRHGLMRIGRWFDFTRLPGRARSHTVARKWETFRLHGSLTGDQERSTSSWWAYEGPLKLVFTGIAGGALVVPVQIPSAPSRQAFVEHYLGDPSTWHKIDLVRRCDPNATGGWRYEAHLMVLVAPYVSPRVRARRISSVEVNEGRIVGLDVNVSNITLASHLDGEDFRLTRIARDRDQRICDERRNRRERRLQRELDRSRRAMNRSHYQLSKRQEKRARRREEQGLRPIKVSPMGPRVTRDDGKALQRYLNDQLSKTYWRTKATLVRDQRAAREARRDRVRVLAQEVIAHHGAHLVVEDCSISTWSRSWGTGVARFSPSMLLAAITREAECGGGSVQRIDVRTTGLSQHCPCGSRVSKPLAVRTHRCSTCGLVADRDAVAAMLASFSRTEVVDYTLARRALPEIKRALSSGWQDTQSESTDLFARDGTFIAWGTSTPDQVAVARRTVGTAPHPTLNELGFCRTTSERPGREPTISHARSLLA